MVIRGGFFGRLGEFLFNIDGVAGDVLATLAKEEPDENKDRTAKGKEAVFDGVRPVSGKENHGVDDAETDGVDIPAGEDDFLSERKVTLRQGIVGAVVWMTEDFAVD